VGALILFGMVQITMFAGAVLAREAVPLPRWVGAGVAFAGLVLLMAPGGAGVSAGHALAMAAAGVGWGIYSLAGRGQADALGATAWNFALAVPVGGALALALGDGGMSAEGVTLAVISGAVTSGLGYALWYAVLPELGGSRAAVAQLTVPVLAAFGGVGPAGRAADAALRAGLGAGSWRRRLGGSAARVRPKGIKGCNPGRISLCVAGYILSIDLLFPRGFSSRS
jgi:drug/metabolite transporter (DMT)-like permease